MPDYPRQQVLKLTENQSNVKPWKPSSFYDRLQFGPHRQAMQDHHLVLGAWRADGSDSTKAPPCKAMITLGPHTAWAQLSKAITLLPPPRHEGFQAKERFYPTSVWRGRGCEQSERDHRLRKTVKQKKVETETDEHKEALERRHLRRVSPFKIPEPLSLFFFVFCPFTCTFIKPSIILLIISEIILLLVTSRGYTCIS